MPKTAAHYHPGTPRSDSHMPLPGKICPSHVLTVIFGVAAGAGAVILGHLPTKYTAAVFAVLILAAFALPLRNSERLTGALIALLAFMLPVNLDINFFYRPHVGGASGIGITGSLLIVFALYALLLYRYMAGLQQPLFRYNRMLLWAPLLYMAAGVLSLLNADYPELTLLGLLRLGTMLLTLIIVMNIRSYRHVAIFIIALSANVALQGALAATQYATGNSLGLGIFGEESLVTQNIGHVVSRATATVGHPNILGYFFEITLPIIFGLFIVAKGIWKKLWFLGVLGIGLVGIGTTLSRGAWISLPVGLFIVFWVLYRKQIFKIASAASGFVLGCIFLVGLYYAFPTIEKRFSHTDYKSSASRMPLNLASISIIKQFPITGVGLNNFSEVFKRYDTTGKSRIFKGYKHVVHNLYLFVWTEVGTIGFIAFLWVFIATFLVARSAYPRAPPWAKAVLVGICAGIVSHMIHGMVDPGFKVTLNISLMIYAFIGLVGAIWLIERAKCMEKADRISTTEIHATNP
ncbi:O-antigen ligase family protein [Thiohalobacter sp. IOR34]|uniref:O-antigen ligase family protein n=1 Tax=Thiohalobacter sp. IOR34 TaxID=3057176 RepID=UPI0025B2594A|nr:O-antigen ligase family protein [Thiohalobacter sp. IOR34]WJW76297.1 O-antigen ligase family protein [Thiohalobacter sp. IOR34]